MAESAKAKLAQRRVADAGRSRALAATQVERARPLLVHLPELASFMQSWNSTGLGALCSWESAEHSPLGVGGHSRVIPAKVQLPEPDRVKSHTLALKIYGDPRTVYRQVDIEVSRMLGIHMRFERVRIPLAPEAVPLRAPIPKVYGLHCTRAEWVESEQRMTEPALNGIYLESYSKALSSLIRGGRLSIGDFMRTISAVTVAVGVMHAQRKVARRLSLSGRHTAGDADSDASPSDCGEADDDGCEAFCGALHCDIKPANVLIQVDDDDQVAMPVHTKRQALRMKRANPCVCLADLGLAFHPSSSPRRHDTELVTSFYRPPDLALSDLVRRGANIEEHLAALPPGAPQPASGRGLKLGASIDIYSAGVSCWAALGMPTAVFSGTEELRQIVRGTVHASGEPALLPTRAGRVAAAFAMWLTCDVDGARPTPQQIHSVVVETLGEALTCGAWGRLAVARLNGEEWPEGAMPVALLQGLARSAQTRSRRGSHRDRAVAAGAQVRAGEIVSLWGVGDLAVGRAVPSPHIPRKGHADLDLPEEWPDQVMRQLGLSAATMKLRRRPRPTRVVARRVPLVRWPSAAHSAPPTPSAAEVAVARRARAVVLACALPKPSAALTACVLPAVMACVLRAVFAEDRGGLMLSQASMHALASAECGAVGSYGGYGDIPPWYPVVQPDRLEVRSKWWDQPALPDTLAAPHGKTSASGGAAEVTPCACNAAFVHAAGDAAASMCGPEHGSQLWPAAGAPAPGAGIWGPPGASGQEVLQADSSWDGGAVGMCPPAVPRALQGEWVHARELSETALSAVVWRGIRDSDDDAAEVPGAPPECAADVAIGDCLPLGMLCMEDLMSSDGSGDADCADGRARSRSGDSVVSAARVNDRITFAGFIGEAAPVEHACQVRSAASAAPAQRPPGRLWRLTPRHLLSAAPYVFGVLSVHARRCSLTSRLWPPVLRCQRRCGVAAAVMSALCGLVASAMIVAASSAAAPESCLRVTAPCRGLPRLQRLRQRWVACATP
eukprot:jgi/Ulvmu1/129/UM001_0133.1